MVAVAQLVRALDCDSGGRGFKSRQPPHLFNDLAKTIHPVPSLIPSLKRTSILGMICFRMLLKFNQVHFFKIKYLYFLNIINKKILILFILNNFVTNRLMICPRILYPRYTLATGGTGREHRQQTSKNDRRSLPMCSRPGPCVSGGRGFKSTQPPHFLFISNIIKLPLIP